MSGDTLQGSQYHHLEMDDDLVDVIIVVAVLGVGVIGGIVLLFLHVERLRRLCQCGRNEEEEEKVVRRTTIRVVRKANTIHAEEGRSVAAKTPLSRMFSDPTRPVQTPPSVTTKNQFVFIVPKTPTYKTEMSAHQVVSAQSSHSTNSSYLPSQLAPQSPRRGSM